MKRIIFLALVLLVGCAEIPELPGRPEIYDISIRTDTLVDRGERAAAREAIHAFLSEPFTARKRYDSLLIGRLYARLNFISRLDSLYRWAEPGIDLMAYPFYKYLPDTQQVHLHRWSARSALMATDTARAFSLLAESFHIGLLLGDSLEMARTMKLWQTIRKAPGLTPESQALGHSDEGFPSARDGLLLLLLIWAGSRLQKRIHGGSASGGGAGL